jgi:hypothetical protein
MKFERTGDFGRQLAENVVACLLRDSGNDARRRMSHTGVRAGMISVT